MSTSTLLILVLVIALLGAVPAWPHSYGWGYRPAAALGALLLILIGLAKLGWV